MAFILALLALFSHPEKPVYYVLPAIAHAQELPATFPVPLTISQMIDNAAVQAGVSTTTARAIAWCESNYRQYTEEGTLVRGPDGHDIGIMQIRDTAHEEVAKSENLNIYTIDGNLRYGMQLLKTNGTTPWNSSKHCWQRLLDDPALVPK
jgi:soluble lytic murein transglycosylase-like protein